MGAALGRALQITSANPCPRCCTCAVQEGGLGDVVTALGRAVQEEGHEVEVVLPKYDCINYNLVQVSISSCTCSAVRAVVVCFAAAQVRLHQPQPRAGHLPVAQQCMRACAR